MTAALTEEGADCPEAARHYKSYKIYMIAAVKTAEGASLPKTTRHYKFYMLYKTYKIYKITAA